MKNLKLIGLVVLIGLGFFFVGVPMMEALSGGSDVSTAVDVGVEGGKEGVGKAGDAVGGVDVPETGEEAADLVNEKVANPAKQYGSIIGGLLVMAGLLWIWRRMSWPLRMVLAGVAGAVVWVAISQS